MSNERDHPIKLLATPFGSIGFLPSISRAWPARPAIPWGRPDNNRPFGGHILNRNAYYSLPNGKRHFVKRRVFSAPEKEGSIERGF